MRRPYRALRDCCAPLNHRSFGLATRSPNIVGSSTNWDRLPMYVHVVYILDTTRIYCSTMQLYDALSHGENPFTKSKRRISIRMYSLYIET